jgi:hypothetical protein
VEKKQQQKNKRDCSKLREKTENLKQRGYFAFFSNKASSARKKHKKNKIKNQAENKNQ